MNRKIRKRLAEMESEPAYRRAFARFAFVTTLNGREKDFATERAFRLCKAYLIRIAALRYANGPLPCTPDTCLAAARQIIAFHIDVDRRYNS